MSCNTSAVQVQAVVERHGQISPTSSSSTSPRAQPSKEGMTAISALPSEDPQPNNNATHQPLPSLCRQVREPEPHPDFHRIMANLRQRGQAVAVPPVVRGDAASNTTEQGSKTAPFSVPLFSQPLHRGSPNPPATRWSNMTPSSYAASPAQMELPGRSRGKPAYLDLSPPRPASVYATAQYDVAVARYITNDDPRGFLPVYEYRLSGQTLMIDMETSYVNLTSLLSALGPTRANILRMLESSVELQPYVHRVKAGFLKIQGYWVPYCVAREVARRVAWSIRFDLVPFFGYHFPTQCLSPNDAGFGDVRLIMGARRTKRSLRAEQQALMSDASALPSHSRDTLHPTQRYRRCEEDQRGVSDKNIVVELHNPAPSAQSPLPSRKAMSSLQ